VFSGDVYAKKIFKVKLNLIMKTTKHLLFLKNIYFPLNDLVKITNRANIDRIAWLMK
jgi:hypothetical protein